MLKRRSLRLEEDLVYRTWLGKRLLRRETERKVCVGNETVLCHGHSVPGNSPVVMSGPGADSSGRKLCPHLPVAYEGRCL